MTYHIIGCGDTGKHWKGQGTSIGVNDAGKWGFPLDHLILVNAPNQFQESRLEMIIKTKSKIWSNMPEFWMRHFPTMNRLHLRDWSKGDKIKPGTFYHSKTSPFVAMSLAQNLGAKEIVLWGVDLVNHPNYGKDTTSHTFEMIKYDSFIRALRGVGVNTFIGSKGTSFDKTLEVWSNSLS